MNFKIILGSACVCGLLFLACSAKNNKKSEKVINTTELCKDVKGFKGPVPVEVTFRNGKVVQVKPLPNHESPGFFKRLTESGFFKSWNGMTAAEVEKAHVDAVTGATYSSTAVIKNVKAAARQAQK